MWRERERERERARERETDYRSQITCVSNYSTQPHEEGIDELTLEEIMEEHYEELHDEDVELDIGDFTDIQSEVSITTKSKRTAAMQKNEKNSVDEDEDELSHETGMDSTEAPGEDENEWRAQNILTDWGRTDDVVTIGNGEKYYFFKLPHKVRNVECNCMISRSDYGDVSNGAPIP